jgi:hypothetical protein
MLSEDKAKSTPSLTLAEDNRILKGFLEGEKAMHEELTKAGHSRAAVLDRALALGVTREFITLCKRSNAKAAIRKCLLCSKHFASIGSHNRLCQHCRKQ